MDFPDHYQADDQLSDSVEQQVEEFRQSLNSMTGFYRKSIYMVAANRIKQELEEMDKPEPPKLLNPRRVQDLLVQPVRFIASRIASTNNDNNQSQPIVIDIPSNNLKDVE